MPPLWDPVLRLPKTPPLCFVHMIAMMNMVSPVVVALEGAIATNASPTPRKFPCTRQRDHANITAPIQSMSLPNAATLRCPGARIEAVVLLLKPLLVRQQCFPLYSSRVFRERLSPSRGRHSDLQGAMPTIFARLLVAQIHVLK